MSEISNQIRAVFLMLLVVSSLSTVTVVFSETTVAADAQYSGRAVHYSNNSAESGNYVIEIPFEDGARISEDALTASNFTVFNGNTNITNQINYSRSVVSRGGDTVYLNTDGELIYGDDLEIELSDQVVTSQQTISVAVAGQSYNTSQLNSNINAYHGTKIAVYNSSSPPSSISIEGTDSAYFQTFASGENSEVFYLNTGSLSLDTYQTSLGGNITLRNLGLTVTVADQTVTTGGTIEGTVSALAGGRTILLQLVNEGGDTIEERTANLGGAGEYDFTFDADRVTGDYRVVVTDQISRVQATSSSVTVISDTTDLAGNGTATDPYIVTSVADLQAIEQDTTAYYELGTNINATGTLTWNSGHGFDPIESFSGTFDGNGHTITGLTINRSNESTVGLFGSVTDSGTISDVAIVAANITGSDNVGGVAGKNNGVIQRLYVAGRVTGNSDVGGIVGDNQGFIVASHSLAAVIGENRIGGLVGFNNENSTVDSSYASGPVTGDTFVGGLIGKQRVYSSSVTQSYWDQVRTSQQSSAGGIGLNTSQMTGKAAQKHMTGFNFNDTWLVTGHYPVLRSISRTSGSAGGARITARSTNIAVGTTTTVSLRVQNLGGDIGAIETTLTISNSSVGAIESVTVSGSPNQTNITYSESNDSVSVKAYGMDLATEETPVVIQVAVSADVTGTTVLGISNTVLGSSTGQDIPVRVESGATIRSVELNPVAGFDHPPTDPDNDGEFEDINGNSEITVTDVQAVFVNLDDPVLQNNTELFDFSGNNKINIVDVQRLFVEVT